MARSIALLLRATPQPTMPQIKPLAVQRERNATLQRFAPQRQPQDTTLQMTISTVSELHAMILWQLTSPSAVQPRQHATL
jgi:hypothetical protein